LDWSLKRKGEGPKKEVDVEKNLYYQNRGKKEERLKKTGKELSCVRRVFNFDRRGRNRALWRGRRSTTQETETCFRAR